MIKVLRELRHIFRQASFIMLSKFFHVLLGKEVVTHGFVEVVLVHGQNGLLVAVFYPVISGFQLPIQARMHQFIIFRPWYSLMS